MSISSRFIFFGAVNAALAVILGAFGKHALMLVLSVKAMETWRTGAYYHLIHALALVLVGMLLERGVQMRQRAMLAGWLLLGGMLLFSGSLYLLSVTGLTVLGFLTPIGGCGLIVGWFWLAWSVT